MARPDFSSLTLSELAERAADPDGIPGVGAVCAAVVQVSAALIAGASRASGEQWEDAGGAAAQAEALGTRAAELATLNATGYREAREALRRVLAGEAAGDSRLAETLEVAAETPTRIAEVACDVAELAAAAAAAAMPELRPDACGAAQLAASAATGAAALVRVNLLTANDDPRLEKAEVSAARAEAASRDALAAVAQL